MEMGDGPEAKHPRRSGCASRGCFSMLHLQSILSFPAEGLLVIDRSSVSGLPIADII